MTPRDMQLIEHVDQLKPVAEHLQGAQRLYLDTEFESTKAGKTLCLVQVSKGETVFLLDTLRLTSLSPLRPAFAEESTEWVLHAALQDIELLTEALDIPVPKLLFDTQVAWSLLSAENAVALAYLKYVVLGVRSGKAHQADDWKRRPLPDSQLRYAAADIEQLPALRDELGRQAEALNRVQVILDASKESVLPQPNVSEALNLSSFRHAWQLGVESQAALRHLIEWHNGLTSTAKSEAPDTKTLLAIAQRLPKTAKDLGRIKGVPRRWLQQSGERFTTALVQAARNGRRQDFVAIDPPPYATFEEISLDSWLAQLRAELSVQLRAAPEALLPQRQLRQLKTALSSGRRGEEALTVLSPWRRQLIAPHFAAFCATHRPPEGQPSDLG